MAKKKYQLRPFTQDDVGFLFQVYAGNRLKEMALTGWSQSEIEEFLNMQFHLQHVQYMDNFKKASFDIIYINDTPVGRLYVDRGKNDILVIDIALQPEYRRQGICATIFRDLIEESEKKRLPIRLHVEHDNPILPYYAQLGFTQIDDTGVYYYMERTANGVKPAEV